MIAIGSDHAGFELKVFLQEHLTFLGYETLDLGVRTATRCDYPDYAALVCQAVQEKKADWGLLVCGTGIGMSMSANKFSGIRAAVVSDAFCAAATRQHNNANILCLGERVVGKGLAKNIVNAWLGAEFEGGRHQQRIDKMMALATPSSR